MRQVAIVGEDAQVRVEDLELGRETRIPTGVTQTDGTTVACNWPTWSPDGTQLAFFRYTIVGAEVRESAVCVAAADGSAVRTVLASPSGSPIYMAWSPGGRRIAVLMQEAASLYLRVARLDDGFEPVTVAQGAPLYFTWVSDEELLANVGAGQGLTATSRLVWLRLSAGQVVRGPLTERPPLGYRAPVWLSTRHAAVVAFGDPAGAKIALVGAGDATPTILVTTGREPACVVSPDQRYVAVASRGEDDALYAHVELIDLSDGSVREVIAAPLLCAFWVGNDRLVTLSGDLAQRTVAVKIAPTNGDAMQDLGWVRPSRDLLLYFAHFDQYVQSAQLIAPNLQEIVFAASRAKELENGSVPTVRQILVRSLGDAGAERGIGRGRLAFWRPA